MRTDSKDPKSDPKKKTPATSKTPRTPHPRPVTMPIMPPAAQTWKTFGDAQGKMIFHTATNHKKYRSAASQFYAKLFFIVRGLSVEEMHDMFSNCQPLYLINGGSEERMIGNGMFEECAKLIEDRVVDGLHAYALIWVDSAGGTIYLNKYAHAK